MDYLILLLVAACVLILLIVHQEIIQFGEGYNKVISQLLPKLGSVNRSMKNAITLGCVVFFGGVISHAYTQYGTDWCLRSYRRLFSSFGEGVNNHQTDAKEPLDTIPGVNRF